MSATIYRLTSDHWPWTWAIEFDYSPAMVEALKRHIPSRDRKWVPAAKQWHFKLGQIEAVEALALAYCGGCVYAERAPSSHPRADLYAVLHLLPTAPDELVRAAYRVMAKRSHPDAGGTTEAMQAVNAAYALLTARGE